MHGSNRYARAPEQIADRLFQIIPALVHEAGIVLLARGAIHVQSAVFGGAQHQDHVGGLGFVAHGLLFDAHGKKRDVNQERGNRQRNRVPYCPFHVRYSELRTLYCNQMAKPETITSAANPLLKDVRRAIARGTLTPQGWCVAETFHLLEEALRSDCEVKTVLAAESVRSAAEAHVRRLAGVKVVVLPDALLQSVSGTETSQGVMALV